MRWVKLRYMEEPRLPEKHHLHTSYLVTNKNNYSLEKKQSFQQHFDQHTNSNEAYTDIPKSKVKKVIFSVVSLNIIRRGALTKGTL